MKSCHSYMKNLLELLSNKNNNIFDNNINNKELIVNLYLTLLLLNNNSYTEDDCIRESQNIKQILIKLNNLKVKIQLNRKEKEIMELANTIKELYKEMASSLYCYIRKEEDLFEIIDSMDASLITSFVDKITKDKMNREEQKEEWDKLREKILTMINDGYYYIDKNILVIKSNDDTIKITLDDFYSIFSYLLDIDNYRDIYKSVSSNREHTNIIRNLINLINSGEYKIDKVRELSIPLVLTYLSTNTILNYDGEIKNFNVENIKITDLYSFAKEGNEGQKLYNWKNFVIPNKYLLDKLNEMTKKGMYYFFDNMFVLELVENKNSDFKISIEKDKMMNFLVNNLNFVLVES